MEEDYYLSFLETPKGSYLLKREDNTFYDNRIYELIFQPKKAILQTLCHMAEKSWKFKAIVKFMYMGKIASHKYEDTQFAEVNVLSFSFYGTKKDDEFALACKLIPASSWKTWKYVHDKTVSNKNEALEHLRPFITSYLLSHKD